MPKQEIIRSINKYKKEHKRKTYELNRLKLAYNVPGTHEHGELSMLLNQLYRIK